MASGFQVVFFCLISGLLIGQSSSFFPGVVHGIRCRPGWTRFDNRCFLFQSHRLAMADAERACLSLGGNLASVHSAKENQFLRDLVFKACGYYALTWIGAHDGIKEGTWMWTDGSKFDYNAWHHGEPNDYRGEDCVEINYHGDRWNDARCFETKSFVCAMG